MIYITGDLHGDLDIHKLSRGVYLNYSNLTKKDYIIICGDFGCIWYGEKKDYWWLNWLNELPCTILFCDGNHENFDLLYQYPVEEWNGGKIHKIRDSVYHLMRGEIFNIDGKTFFVMGGAHSIDKIYRKEHISWWAQEVPNKEEIQNAHNNLKKYNYKVDYIITHCAPTPLLPYLSSYFERDAVTNILEDFYYSVEYKAWYFGHYHLERTAERKHHCLYNEFLEIKE